EAGDARTAEAGGGDVAVVPVVLDTHAFGRLGGDLQIPIEAGRVAWHPYLVFPGLGPGEHLDRRARLPKRAPILARDGTPLAQGPASDRSSPLGAAAADVAGQMGTP